MHAKSMFATWGMLALAGLVGLAVPNASYGQWERQSIDTQADFRGLGVVSDRVAWVSGTKGTVARTTDAGKTWTVAAVPEAAELDFRDVEAFGESTAYLMSAGPADRSRIYKTTDGGKTWRLQFTNTESDAFYDAIAFWDERHGIAFSDPVKGKFRFLVTEDGGANWRQLSPTSLPAPLPNEAAFAASGTCLVAQGSKDVWLCTGGGRSARILHSKDRGLHWTASQSPIIAGAQSAGIFSIAFRDARHGLVVGGDYLKPDDTHATAARTVDGGKTWTPIESAFPYRSCVAWAIDRWVVVGTTGSDVSTDDGRTWKSLDKENYNSVAFSAHGQGWAAGPKGRIARFVR